MSVNSIDHHQAVKAAQTTQALKDRANEQAERALRGETHQGTGTTTQTGKVVDLNVLVSPPDLGMTGKNANYMQFSSFTMRGGVGSSTSDINFEGPHEFVCLPIPSGIGATYEQGWDQQEVGSVSYTHLRAHET